MAGQPFLLHHCKQAQHGGVRQRVSAVVDLLIKLRTSGFVPLPEYFERLQFRSVESTPCRTSMRLLTSTSHIVLVSS